MSDTARSILQRTHDELLDREQRLQAFADELAETTAARKAIAKQLAQLANHAKALTSGTTSRNASTDRRGVTDNITGQGAAIINAVQHSLDPLTGPQIANKINVAWGGPVAMQIGRLVKGGHLINLSPEGMTPAYGLPQKLDQPNPADNGAT